MSTSPDITIIIPLHNDEEWVADALASALNQTWASLEVICIDDASTDGTCAVVERMQETDARVRLYRHSVNRTAFQARKLGVEQARGSYVLFLDGDDRLSVDAAEVAITLARAEGADLVGFGVDVITSGGPYPTRFAADLQPDHASLDGGEIVRGLFPIGKVAQGHLWRYLWAVDVLRAAYDALEQDLQLPRANDIPVCFLGAVLSSRYVSTKKKLYQYFWRRGVSGLATDTESAFDFYLSAMDSVDAIGMAIESPGSWHDEIHDLDTIFDSVRLSMIQVLLRRCEETADIDLRTSCLRKLIAHVGLVDAVRSSSLYVPSAFPLLAQDDRGRFESPHRPPRVVMLTTGNLDVGGVQGVLVAQAKLLRESGYRVVVAVQRLGASALLLPDDVPIVEWTGRNRADKIANYLRVCDEYNVDVIIDHHILYNDYWQFFALAARAKRIPTIGWLHNFALRSLYDSTTRGSFLAQTLPILANVVVLSKVDVAFWKLRGVERVTYLPNPPSPWLESNGVAPSPKSWDGGVLRLVWWGRLQQHTKRVLDFVDVAEELRKQGLDFHLTIIGPDSADASAAQLRALVAQRGLDSQVTVKGPLHGQELSDALDDAHVYVSLSGIEGYPLTLIEAQAVGLPVVMYELPWLAVLDRNAGVSSVPQGDRRELVNQLVQIASDPSRYGRMSEASLHAAVAATDHDFPRLYESLFHDELRDTDLSPVPTESDMRLLLDLAMAFSEEGIRRAGRVERRAQGRHDKLRRQFETLQVSASKRTPRPKAATVSSTSFGRRIVRRVRVVSLLIKGRVLGTASVIGAVIANDDLQLRLRTPRGGLLQSVQLYREVDGVEIMHELVLTTMPDGTALGSCNAPSILRRRWRIRATTLVAGAKRMIDVPIHPRATKRGDGHYVVRFPPDGTVQVQSHGN